MSRRHTTWSSFKSTTSFDKNISCLGGKYYSKDLPSSGESQKYKINFDIKSCIVPDSLKGLHEFQMLLIKDDIDPNNDIKQIKDFILKYPELGYHQLEISAAIRPRLYERYRDLILGFSDIELNYFFTNYKVPEPIFSAIVISGRVPIVGMNAETPLFIKDHAPFEANIYDKSVFKALVKDDSDFFVQKSVSNSLTDDMTFIMPCSRGGLGLTEAACLLGSIKCLKYFLVNNFSVENCGKAAVASGNVEIVRLLEQNHVSFENLCDIALMYRNDDIFDWLPKVRCTIGSLINTNMYTIKAQLALSRFTIKQFQTKTFISLSRYNLITPGLFRSLYTNDYCFVSISDTQLIASLINADNAFNLLLAAIIHNRRNHALIVVNHPAFDVTKITGDFNTVFGYDKSVTDIIKSKPSYPEFVYNFYTESTRCSYINQPIFDIRYIVGVIDYAHKKGGTKFIEKILSDDNIKELSIDQLFGIAKYQIESVIYKLCEIDLNTEQLHELCEVIDINFFLKAKKAGKQDIIMNAFSNCLEFWESITAKEVYKFMMLIGNSLNIYDAFVKSLEAKGYLPEKMNLMEIENVPKVVFSSTAFVEGFDINYALSNSSSTIESIIWYLEKVEMNEEQFLRLLNLLKNRLAKCDTDSLTEIILNPKYDSYIDKYLDDITFIKFVGEMKPNKSRIFNDSQKFKRINNVTIIQYANSCDLPDALMSRILSKEDVNNLTIRMNGNDFPVDQGHFMLSRDDVFTYAPISIKIKFLFDSSRRSDDLTIKIMDSICSTKLSFSDESLLFKSINMDNAVIKQMISKKISHFRPFFTNKIQGVTGRNIFVDGSIAIDDVEELHEMLPHLMLFTSPDKLIASNRILNQELFKCASNKQTDKAEFLLRAGANINSIDENGDTILFKAIACKNTDLIKLLLDRGAETGVIGRSSALIEAIVGLDKSLIARILKETDIPKLQESLGLCVAKTPEQKYENRTYLNRRYVRNVAPSISIVQKLNNGAEVSREELDLIFSSSFFDSVLYSVPENIIRANIQKLCINIIRNVVKKEAYEEISKCLVDNFSTYNAYKIMLNAFEKRDIKGVDNCLANKLDPNHVFYENGETTTVLNLAIAAGEEFFDHVMKYNPVTRRVVKESPLEVAIKYNVDFLYKVLEIVDPDDENDARIVKNLKYMLPNDAPFEKVKSAEKNTIRSPISNEFYVSLSSRKVLVFANQHKEFFLDDPDEFEASDHGFYNVPNIAKYLFTGVDTIIVDEKQSNDKETLAMICESFTAETERKIFVVQNDSKRLGVFSKYEPQRIYLTSSKRYP